MFNDTHLSAIKHGAALLSPYKHWLIVLSSNVNLCGGNLIAFLIILSICTQNQIKINDDPLVCACTRRVYIFPFLSSFAFHLRSFSFSFSCNAQPTEAWRRHEKINRLRSKYWGKEFISGKWSPFNLYQKVLRCNVTRGWPLLWLSVAPRPRGGGPRAPSIFYSGKL